jgi:hypothetical protein
MSLAPQLLQEPAALPAVAVDLRDTRTVRDEDCLGGQLDLLPDSARWRPRVDRSAKARAAWFWIISVSFGWCERGLRSRGPHPTPRA